MIVNLQVMKHVPSQPMRKIMDHTFSAKTAKEAHEEIAAELERYALSKKRAKLYRAMRVKGQMLVVVVV